MADNDAGKLGTFVSAVSRYCSSLWQTANADLRRGEHFEKCKRLGDKPSLEGVVIVRLVGVRNRGESCKDVERQCGQYHSPAGMSVKLTQTA